MAGERDPEVIAAEWLRADPSAVRRRLQADLDQVRALGRTGARVDLALGDADIAARVRERADRIGFESPVDAAMRSMRHIEELPASERGRGSPIPAYHAAAGRTITEGELKAQTISRGVRHLVFHRTAPVAAGVSVTLEATVRIIEAGSVWLESFSWPGPRTAVPVYLFDGTPEDYLAEALASLRQDGPFDQAMLLIFAAGLRSAHAVGDDAQRVVLAEAVAAHRGPLAAYVSQATTYAESVRADGGFGACLYRSALETLFEDFLGSVAFSLVDQQDLDDIDEELRDSLPTDGPLPAPMIPPGVRPHHWWWTSAAKV